MFNGVPDVLPSGWSWKRLSEVAQINPESLGASTPPDYRFRYIDIGSVDKGNICWKDIAEEIYRSAPSRARRVVRKGDVLFGNVRTALQSHGYVEDEEGDQLVASTGFTVLRAIDGRVLPKFLFHVILGDEVTAQARRAETGSNYPAVSEFDVASFHIALPPPSEQLRITEILDTLGEAIRLSDRAITKLWQIKQGMLQDLLTRGIGEDGELRDQDRNAELFKESAFGLIPREWKLVEFGDLFADVYRYPSYYGIEYSEAGVAEIRGELIRPDGSLEPDLSKYRYVSEATAAQFSRVRVQPGDFVLTVRGTVGKVAEIPPELTGSVITANLLRCSFRRELVSVKWLKHFLLSGKFQNALGLASSATTIETIQIPALSSIHLLLPSVREQHRIAAVLEGVDARLRQESEAVRKLKHIKEGLLRDLLSGRVRFSGPKEAACS